MKIIYGILVLDLNIKPNHVDATILQRLLFILFLLESAVQIK